MTHDKDLLFEIVHFPENQRLILLELHQTVIKKMKKFLEIW